MCANKTVFKLQEAFGMRRDAATRPPGWLGGESLLRLVGAPIRDRIG
jgi:hypothetical protein